MYSNAVPVDAAARPAAVSSNVPPAAVATAQPPPRAEADAFGLQMESVLGLEESGKFDEAFARAQSLKAASAGHPKVSSLDPVLDRLKAEKAAAPDLLAAIEELGSANNWNVLQAKDRLVKGGAAGKILLRQALREQPLPIADIAGSILAEMRDEGALATWVERLKQSDETPVSSALVDSLLAMEENLDPSEFFSLLRFVEQRKAGVESPAPMAVAAEGGAAARDKTRQGWLNAGSDGQPADLDRVLARVAVSAYREGDQDLVRRLCEAMSGGGPATNAVKSARAGTDIPRRLQLLRQAGLPPRMLLTLYREQFFLVAQRGDREALKAMLSLNDEFASLTQKESEKVQIRTMALDGAFLLEDYARALQILEAGIPNRDKNWHAMTISKVKAHLALQQGKPREAVAYFREFMDWINRDAMSAQDPCTGILHTREMLLGFNAKRVADILRSAGDEKGAAAAYDESRKYYGEALSQLKPGSREQELVKSELAALPAAKPNP